MPAQATFALVFSENRSAERAGRAAARRDALSVIDVPSGVSHFSLTQSGRPQLTTRKPAGNGALVMEPVLYGPYPALLLIRSEDGQARINGQIAPLVSVLMEKDQVELGSSGCIFHVTQRLPPTVGPVPEEVVGMCCPVCRTRFEPGAVVYVCKRGRCRQPLHADPPSKVPGTAKGRDRFSCAYLLKNCPNCTEPVNVNLTEAYSYVPDDMELADA